MQSINLAAINSLVKKFKTCFQQIISAKKVYVEAYGITESLITIRTTEAFVINRLMIDILISDYILFWIIL